MVQVRAERVTQDLVLVKTTHSISLFQVFGM